MAGPQAILEKAQERKDMDKNMPIEFLTPEQIREYEERQSEY